MAINPQTFAPIVAMGATVVARKVLKSGYEARTGHAPPTKSDTDVPWLQVIGWAVLSAVVAAAIEVVVNRGAAEIEARMTSGGNDLQAIPQDASA